MQNSGIIYPPFLEYVTFSDFLREALSVLPEFLSRFLSFILGVLFPLGLQILILGTTTILLSRTFTYRVKSTPGAVKWIIAILAGVGSCVCFISLYWFTLRSFLRGERISIDSGIHSRVCRSCCGFGFFISEPAGMYRSERKQLNPVFDLQLR